MAQFKKDLFQEANLKIGRRVAHRSITMSATMFGTLKEVKEKTVIIDFDGTLKECPKKEVTVLWN